MTTQDLIDKITDAGLNARAFYHAFGRVVDITKLHGVSESENAEKIWSLIQTALEDTDALEAIMDEPREGAEYRLNPNGKTFAIANYVARKF